MMLRIGLVILCLLCGLLPPNAEAQSSPSLAADTCVSYAADGTTAYRLTNACDYEIQIAFCSQPRSEPTLCLTSQSWQRETLAAKARGTAPLSPDNALDLFACRTPGTVEILPSGMARCLAGPPVPVIPIMSAASLKNPGGIVTDTDYPATTARLPEGTSRFDLMVGPDGRPTSCTVTASAGAAELDNAACKAFMRRARFTPAKNEAGQPTTGRYRGSVTWKMP